MNAGIDVIGINYESNKIIRHILQYECCIGYANCQIVMDAPFHGRVAGENIRGKGRSELQFDEYNESYVIQQFRDILNFIKNKYQINKTMYCFDDIVIQIARGRAAQSMIDDVFMDLLNEFELKDTVSFVHGYRSSDYYRHKTNKKFIFINVGMFAVIGGVTKTTIGEVFNPCDMTGMTDIYAYDSRSEEFIMNNVERVGKKKLNDEHDKKDSLSMYDHEKNILNQMSLNRVVLYGIADNMPFVTPDVYSEASIEKLVNIQIVV